MTRQATWYGPATCQFGSRLAKCRQCGAANQTQFGVWYDDKTVDLYCVACGWEFGSDPQEHPTTAPWWKSYTPEVTA